MNCPKCKWEPPSDCPHHNYQIIDGKAEILEIEYIKDGNSVKPIPRDDSVIYPIITNYIDKGYYELDWNETHRCPNCNREFTFSNGT